MDTRKKHTCIFGPVPSRRLGSSLGIDLVPFKTCTYDCIYCQLGRTTDRTTTRREYVPTRKIMEELAGYLKKPPGAVDYITLSGSGEPTLHAGVGRIISSIKRMTDVPVAVLTNGSLLHDPEVAEELMPADVVVPTLAADSETVFQCVHRPHPDLHFETVAEGIRNFAKSFKNRLWLEVFLLDGINSMKKTVESIKAMVDSIKPEKIQINTATRPPSEEFAFPVPESRLNSLASLFGSGAEVISEFRDTVPHRQRTGKNIEENVLALLRRRPCTTEDVSAGLSLHSVEAIKVLSQLVDGGTLKIYRRNDKNYYRVK